MPLRALPENAPLHWMLSTLHNLRMLIVSVQPQSTTILMHRDSDQLNARRAGAREPDVFLGVYSGACVQEDLLERSAIVLLIGFDRSALSGGR